ncbi:hypothetical protein GGX14DRAFT_564245 [Mycena pura]|uniref:Uncharacterized protein n=1 Tax=Mycena pura TaxID=153505 RepID=A0AAD6VIE4_9AGAR|nr:hypothetical protein GGX14DRAFT_564245 [Mycena pura]
MTSAWATSARSGRRPGAVMTSSAALTSAISALRTRGGGSARNVRAGAAEMEARGLRVAAHERIAQVVLPVPAHAAHYIHRSPHGRPLFVTRRPLHTRAARYTVPASRKTRGH